MHSDHSGFPLWEEDWEWWTVTFPPLYSSCDHLKDVPCYYISFACSVFSFYEMVKTGGYLKVKRLLLFTFYCCGQKGEEVFNVILWHIQPGIAVRTHRKTGIWILAETSGYEYLHFSSLCVEGTVTPRNGSELKVCEASHKIIPHVETVVMKVK